MVVGMRYRDADLVHVGGPSQRSGELLLLGVVGQVGLAKEIQGKVLYACGLACVHTVSFYELKNRSEEHTSELQSLMRISYAVFCLKKKKTSYIITHSYTKSIE